LEGIAWQFALTVAIKVCFFLKEYVLYAEGKAALNAQVTSRESILNISMHLEVENGIIFMRKTKEPIFGFALKDVLEPCNGG
jgi:hypothetical protein